MRILIKRTGGFAGLEESVADVNTADMDIATAQPVEQLVQSLGFFDLPIFIFSEGEGADLFHYEITVIQDDKHHTVAFNDDGSQSTLPLKKFVEMISHIG